MKKKTAKKETFISHEMKVLRHHLILTTGTIIIIASLLILKIATNTEFNHTPVHYFKAGLIAAIIGICIYFFESLRHPKRK